MTKDRYLFRGFHKEENGKETIYIDGQPIKGKWVFGDLTQFPREKSSPIITEYKKLSNDLWEQTPYLVIPETIGQYTGIENPWNQKIFEHDILRDYGNEIEDWEVSYEYGKFVGTYDNVCEDLWEIHDFEVIGTIFDKEVNDNE